MLLRAGLEGCGGKTSKLPLGALERAELPSPGTGLSQQGGLQRGSCRVWGSVGDAAGSPGPLPVHAEPSESPPAPVC